MNIDRLFAMITSCNYYPQYLLIVGYRRFISFLGQFVYKKNPVIPNFTHLRTTILFSLLLKPILLILLFAIFYNPANAQFDENNALYFSGERNLGNYLGIDANINYVYKEKYTFKLVYTTNRRNPISQPDDYNVGLVGIFLIGLNKPYDRFENLQIGLGRMYKFNKSGTIRANLSAGLGFATIEEPENWQMNNGSILVSNYTFDYNKYHTVSLIINPKIEFPIFRYFGLTLSPMVQISKDRTYYGIGIGHMFGILRKKLKSSDTEL